MSMPTQRGRPSPIVGIFLTVFLDLLSFGMLIPDLQLRGKQLGATGFQLGLLLAVFSLAQLVTSPYLGRLSDVVGRRKVLVITTILSILSFVFYAHADTIASVLISRILAGIAASNLGVAFAYIADVTKPEERAKSLGTIGAAFGLGFVLGPAIGGFLLKFGNDSPLILGYVGAAFAVVNWIFVQFFLPDSPRVESTGPAPSLLTNLRTAFQTPSLAILLLMFFAVNFGFTNLEATYFQLLETPNWRYHLGNEAKQVGSIILTFVGVVAVIMQGFVVRKLSPILGEVKMVRIGYLFLVPSLALVPYAPLWIPVLLGVLALGIGQGLSQPSLSSLISRSAPSTMQGGIFGITQALGALARCVGPLISNPLFEVRADGPYLLGALICAMPLVASWFIRMPELPPTEPGEPSIVH